MRLRQRQSLMKIVPQEILMDILIRLPAKSVGRCRCVSKQLRDLLSDLHFTKAHLDRTKQSTTNELFILETRAPNLVCTSRIDRGTNDKLTLVAKDLSYAGKFMILEEGLPYCDGLIILEDVSRMARFLMNPTTKEFRELPNPSHPLDGFPRHTTHGLGYDHVNDDYKVVTLSSYSIPDEDRQSEMFVHVYSLRNGTWKQVESSPHAQAVKQIGSGLFLGGSIHWIADNFPLEDESPYIFRFDLAEEKFQVVPAPSSVFGVDCTFVRVDQIGGRLCVVNEKTAEISIWLMKEYGVKESWTKFPVAHDGISRMVPILGTLEPFEMAMWKHPHTKKWKWLMYNLENATFKDIKFRGVKCEFLAGCIWEALISPYYNYDGLREPAAFCSSPQPIFRLCDI